MIIHFSLQLKWWHADIVYIAVWLDDMAGGGPQDIHTVQAGDGGAGGWSQTEEAQGQQNTQTNSSTNQGPSFEAAPGLTQPAVTSVRGRRWGDGQGKDREEQ